MQPAILVVLVASFVLLAVGLLKAKIVMVLISIVTSLGACFLVVRERRRTAERQASHPREMAERQYPAQADGDRALGDRAVGDRAVDDRAVDADLSSLRALLAEDDPAARSDPSSADEPPDAQAEPGAADTEAPLRRRGDADVWVVDGRPRYHLSRCRSIAGKRAEPIALRDAVEYGFTPCDMCDPDTALATAADR